MRSPYLSVASLGVPRLSAALFVIVLLSSAPWCLAQNPTAAAVITDQTALPAVSQFGVPNLFRLTNNGDVYFAAGGGTALFRWIRETGERRRLLQTNDTLDAVGLPPEILLFLPPGSLVDTAASLLQVGAGGHAAIVASAAITGERDPTGAFVYDGSAFRFVASDLDSYSQLFVNAAGRVAVQGFPYTFGPSQIYLETSSGEMKLAAEAYTPAPAPVGGNFSSFTLIGFTDSGQAAFLAAISGGAASTALFLADGNSVKVVVANGDSAAGGGRFSLRSGAVNYILNNSGEVAFAADASGGQPGIWIGSATAAPALVARQSDPTGAALGGTFSAAPVLRGFNDAGQVLFSSNVTGGSSSHALFLKDRDAQVAKVVFSRGHSAAAAATFDITQQASLNNDGNIAFLATLAGGTSPAGLFFGSGTAEPVKIVFQGEETPIGGVFGLLGRNVPPLINSAAQVVFLADLPGADAVALFSWTGAGGIVPVVSTNDALPDGASTVLRGLLTASDSETLVRVLKAGGQAALYAIELKPGANSFRKIVAEFDKAPDLGTVYGPGNLAANAKGEVVFFARLMGSGVYPQFGVLSSRPDTGMQKVILSGEDLPGGGRAGTAFGPPQLNNQSQIAFHAATDIPNVTGIFLAALDGSPVQQIVRTGDAWPGGGSNTYGSLNINLSLNDSGQVAFMGTSSSQPHPGLFIGSAGAPPLKVAEAGDPAPSGAVTNLTTPFELNADGKLAFFANYGSGSSSGSGIFLGSSAGPPQAVATTGVVVPGTGGQSFGFISASTMDLNSAGQVAFWAGLCCSGPGNGWFVGSAGSEPAPRLLQNQELPAGGRVSNLTVGTRYAVLADSGELAVFVADTRETLYQPAIIIAAAGGRLRHFAGNGEPAAGTDSQFNKLFPTLYATPSGRFLFTAMLAGQAKAGVFVNAP